MPNVRQQRQISDHREPIGADAGAQRNIRNDQWLTGKQRQRRKHGCAGEYQEKGKQNSHYEAP